ncbi:MAG TPA: NAD(P)H-binding protein [Parapedobacter sp.]|uniref:NAD(P)H-binding protein n=1 Tax=Parapedobacter sp. TaxID=1958893 RepID=UPI002BB6247C|nr:NAD(P)H-binding protein [Parapedobacter sp.]HWK58962.1 NAD(P)H-binding protein [Parapedobacter sp.]
MATQQSAILFGATGLIGGHLLQELLNSPAYAAVTIVVRRDTGVRHAKLSQLFADHQSLDNIREQLRGDHIFCCVGTTKKKTPDLDEYYRIDHDYPVAAAQYTKDNGASAFLLVSAVGANPASSNFYLRMKGETERDIIRLGFEQTHVFRPSLLTGDRREKRGMESLGSAIFKVINPLLINGLSKYKAIPAAWVSKALCRVAITGEQGVHTYHWADIKKRI